MQLIRGRGDDLVTAGPGKPTHGLLILSEIRLYREGLARLLSQAMNPALVRTACNAGEALDLIGREPIDVVLIDLALPQALCRVRQLLEPFPALRVVGLGAEDDQRQVVACAEAGIIGFVTRSAGLSDLVAAIHCAASGELNCSRRIAGALARRVAALAGASDAARRHLPLTRRELEVLRLVDEGLTNKEIAARLHISVATVRNHVHNILDRLNVRTRSRAVAVARRMLASV